MALIIVYSLLLIAGMAVSQLFNLDAWKHTIEGVSTFCLAYIMLEVGLEFSIDKTKLKSYGWDFIVATAAALVPALLWIAYLTIFFQPKLNNVLLVGLSTAPTSAGVLFAMLWAAGLGKTWVFQKARVLAVFDDLATILLLIPIQIVLIGFKPELAIVVVLILGLLMIAYFKLNTVYLPTQREWLVLYSLILVGVLTLIEHSTHIHFTILLPAFTLGCVLVHSHHEPVITEKTINRVKFQNALDQMIKGVFMLLVGCSLPKVDLSIISPTMLAVHVIALTILSNLGKCIPYFCYKQASVKERLGLSIAMFPRGEVGAGVLLIALSLGFTGKLVTLGTLSLALNLILTGLFVSWVVRLTQAADKGKSHSHDHR